MYFHYSKLIVLNELVLYALVRLFAYFSNDRFLPFLLITCLWFLLYVIIL